MLLSYIAAGLIVTIPYLWLSNEMAGLVSIAIAFVALYSVGYFKAKRLGIKNKVRSGLETLIVGGVCTLIGIAVGYIMRIQ
jgi:VIT1/CCC1 family predicted Fe2+/Mn2+ transporter